LLAIGSISVVSRTHPRLGGWLAAFPLISFLSVIWLAADSASTSDLSAFIGRVLVGQNLKAILLAILFTALSHGLSLPLVILCAGVAWAVLSITATYLGLFG